MKKAFILIISLICTVSLISCSAGGGQGGSEKSMFDYPVSAVGESVLGDEKYRFKLNIENQSFAKLEVIEPDEISGTIITFDGDNTVLTISGTDIPISEKGADSVKAFVKPFMFGKGDLISDKEDKSSGLRHLSDNKNEYILTVKDGTVTKLLIKNSCGTETDVNISDYTCGLK